MNRLGQSFSSAPRIWNGENVPPSPDPERPPLAPYDPPDPAPQAAAWERALRVIFMESSHGSTGVTKSRSWRTNKRGRAAIKIIRKH
jgi:hypothetical protein